MLNDEVMLYQRERDIYTDRQRQTEKGTETDRQTHKDRHRKEQRQSDEQTETEVEKTTETVRRTQRQRKRQGQPARQRKEQTGTEKHDRRHSKRKLHFANTKEKAKDKKVKNKERDGDERLPDRLTDWGYCHLENKGTLSPLIPAAYNMMYVCLFSGLADICVDVLPAYCGLVPLSI